MHTMRAMHESTKVTVLSFLAAKMHRQCSIVQFCMPISLAERFHGVVVDLLVTDIKPESE